MAKLTDDADYDAGETFENVSSPHLDAGNHDNYYGRRLRTRLYHFKPAANSASVQPPTWTPNFPGSSMRLRPASISDKGAEVTSVVSKSLALPSQGSTNLPTPTLSLTSSPTTPIGQEHLSEHDVLNVFARQKPPIGSRSQSSSPDLGLLGRVSRLVEPVRKSTIPTSKATSTTSMASSLPVIKGKGVLLSVPCHLITLLEAVEGVFTLTSSRLLFTDRETTLDQTTVFSTPTAITGAPVDINAVENLRLRRSLNSGLAFDFARRPLSRTQFTNVVASSTASLLGLRYQGNSECRSTK
ncbi:unnamed protein product [Protopolystoma xenopodis]|uniref:Uncharacterized protein n=1 Tax=Protopolystoma xenopodis TaxID=117903 RepID=A0A3S5B425_9PLAT|nr:unnamed protein product [Protopolystoma xenopodis]